MKRILLLILILQFSLQLTAQFNVRFIVTESCPLKRENIFISGSFNNWDSLADKKYILSNYGTGQRSIELKLPAGNYSYKYTGGNWLTVEKDWQCRERSDRKINLTKDTVIRDTVVHWRDQFLKNMQWSVTHPPDDTTLLGSLTTLASAYNNNSDFYNPDSSLFYIKQALKQLQIIKSSSTLKHWANYTDWLMYTQDLNAGLLHSLGNYPKSLELRLEQLKIAEQRNSLYESYWIISSMVDDYISMKDYSSGLSYCKTMLRKFSGLKPVDGNYYYIREQFYYRTGICYYNLGSMDSALYYTKALFNFSAKDNPYSIAASSQLLGDIYSKSNAPDTAFHYYRIALSIASPTTNAPMYVRSLEGMAKLFQQKSQVDSALYYARGALNIIQQNQIQLQVWGESTNTFLADICPLIAELYKSNNQLDSAYKYLHLSITVKDSLYSANKIRQFQNLSFNESLRQQQEEQHSRDAQQQYETRIKMYGLITIIAGIMILAFVLYRNNKQKQKANTLLQSQKEEIETTLGELKNTQKQLIQSEKMASLGELTAGIAHEIQNPLNFVNNFSEVNAELIEEALQANKAGNPNEVEELLSTLKDNEEKINHHGKRADAIVKGMLQHSRASSGQKELTDINALSDEYLRLSYHGLRAKDKLFNATTKTDFDTSIGKINIIPQDIGRVLLNLYNNAFYVVNEKKKQQPNDYEPTVSVSSKKIGDKVILTVKDNGNGIPEKVTGKIFQPFFTTKPTGEGTGLGLSLSYDIIKAHGGEIKVETKEGEGTEFIIQLPA